MHQHFLTTNTQSSDFFIRGFRANKPYYQGLKSGYTPCQIHSTVCSESLQRGTASLQAHRHSHGLATWATQASVGCVSPKCQVASGPWGLTPSSFLIPVLSYCMSLLLPLATHPNHLGARLAVSPCVPRPSPRTRAPQWVMHLGILISKRTFRHLKAFLSPSIVMEKPLIQNNFCTPSWTDEILLF